MAPTQVPPPANSTRSGAPPGIVDAAHGGVCLPGNAPHAVELLRWGFAAHGFDSSSYSDTEVSAAILAEAHPELRPRRDLYTRAFARLRNGRTEGT